LAGIANRYQAEKIQSDFTLLTLFIILRFTKFQVFNYNPILMSSAEDLKKWVKTLTPAEKRFVTLIGRARAGNSSQLLDFFDWLNQAAEDEQAPANAAFTVNIPTLAVRLRELILDSLRLLGKDAGTDAVLRHSIDDVQILTGKKLYQPAIRLLRKAKKLAYECSRYTFILQCIEIEQKLLMTNLNEQPEKSLGDLRAEETAVLLKQQVLGELQYRHNELLVLAKHNPFSGNQNIIDRVVELADSPFAEEALASSNYTENALAVNIAGIRDLYLRNPEPAIERYRQLLNNWKQHPQWQADQPELLMTVCKYYQNVCFFSPVDPGMVHADLMALNGFDGLPADSLRTFRETLFHNKFILALNSANFEAIPALIIEIQEWLSAEKKYLSETQVLPFLCNFAVALFLAEDFVATEQLLISIQRMPNKNARTDIRDFAQLMLNVLYYELNDEAKSDSLLRSGKLYFSKKLTPGKFELIVLKHIGLLKNVTSAADKQEKMQQLLQELEKLPHRLAQTMPVLGLNEMKLWALARTQKRAIKAVFTDEVKKQRNQFYPVTL
jgi:hypothetical protein